MQLAYSSLSSWSHIGWKLERVLEAANGRVNNIRHLVAVNRLLSSS